MPSGSWWHGTIRVLPDDQLTGELTSGKTGRIVAVSEGYFRTSYVDITGIVSHQVRDKLGQFSEKLVSLAPREIQQAAQDLQQVAAAQAKRLSTVRAEFGLTFGGIRLEFTVEDTPRLPLEGSPVTRGRVSRPRRSPEEVTVACPELITHVVQLARERS